MVGKKLAALVVSAVLATGTLSLLGPGRASGASGTTATVYQDDRLVSGWENWSWGSTTNLNSTSPPYAIGRSSITVRHTQAWGGLELHYPAGLDVSGRHGISLSVRSKVAGLPISLSLRTGSNAQTVRVVLPSVPTTKFQRYDVAFRDFSLPTSSIRGIIVQYHGPVALNADYYVDEVLVTSAAPDGNCGIPAPQSGLEHRSTNYVQNHQSRVTLPVLAPISGNGRWDEDYYPRINGNCQGTTEQILAWAARKWGFAEVPSVLGGPPLVHPDLAKALAVSESMWRQNALGDPECGAPRPNGISSSLGILQVKNRVCNFENAVWPNAYPHNLRHTALNADYAMSTVRADYDGHSWLASKMPTDPTLRLKRAIGAFYCGCADGGGDAYADKVLRTEADKPWLRANLGLSPYYFKIE